MADSRTKNTKRNIGAGLINKGVDILLPFINRTAILYILGAEFTGLSSLFTSILEVLSLANLGFNTAIVYSLYKPMADNDQKKIIEIVSLYRKIYSVVGTVMLVAGLIIMPFIDNLISGSYPDSINIYLLYFLYLINTVISYFLFAYKECLLIADQRRDISDNIRSVIHTLRYVVQFIVLFITHSFYAYMIVAIIGTAATSICIQIATVKRYPYYHRLKGKQKMPKDLIKQVEGLMINRVCDTFRNSFDSIIVSSFIGLTATAIYSNYYYVYNALYMVMLVICNAMAASVGNSIIKKSEKDNYNDLLKFSFVFAWIMGWCTVCMACLYQPFMEFWAGSDLLLSDLNMFLFCLYFYLINMNNVRNQYISGTGIWWKLKASYIIEAFGNLALNFVLGKIFGITGILIATILTIFLFNYLQRDRVLFREYFKNQRLSKYLIEQFYYMAVTGVAVALTYWLCSFVPFSGLIELVIRGCICIIVPNVVFLLLFRLSPRFKEGMQLVKKVVRV